MPRSEQDDSRPILLRRSDEIPACVTVLGAKIDSIYDVEESIREMLDTHAAAFDAPRSTPDTAVNAR